MVDLILVSRWTISSIIYNGHLLQVSVKNLNVVGSEVWARMREGETEKQVYLFIISLFMFEEHVWFQANLDNRALPN